jgi:hypothetical protein
VDVRRTTVVLTAGLADGTLLRPYIGSGERLGLVRTARRRIPGSARIERRSDKTDDPSPFSGRRALGSLSMGSFPFTGGAVVWMP